MITEKYGKVVKGLGGLFEVRIPEDDGSVIRLALRAKGILKRDEAKVLIGDNVRVTLDDSTPDGVVVSEIAERVSPTAENYFYTQFRELRGMTPLQYRKAYRRAK